MDHVVSPEDVEPIEVEDLEVEAEEKEICAHEDCNTELGYATYECTDCAQQLCLTHVASCTMCDEWICTTCQQTYTNNEVYCLSCYSQLTDCCVCGDTLNTESEHTYWCESHGKHCCSDCYSCNDQCVDCYIGSDSEGHEGGTDAASGISSTAPWEHRGDVHVAHSSYVEESVLEFVTASATEMWGVDQNLSLNQGAADFYLLEVVQHNVDCGEIVEPMLVVMSEEAKTHRKNLVDVYDRSFRGYVDMAIGGELRYHTAVGGGRHLPGTRTQAWRYWKLLRARGGTELLLETAQLFDEIVGGGVGGARWAAAARLLHSRLTNRITPEQWVDRVFTLQHNGGAFTNKIAWGPDHCESGQDITNIIGPAHAAHPTDFRTLVKYASPEATALFLDWWPAANKNRMRWRRNLWVHRTPIDTELMNAMFGWFHAFVNAGWSTESIRISRLEQWQADPVTRYERFRMFFLAREIAGRFGAFVNWAQVDKHMARKVVAHVLDDSWIKIVPSNVHIFFNEYLMWMCSLITDNLGADMQVDAFGYLYQRGVHIPLEYHGAANINPELEPF